jgi:hypothetical protein
MEVTLRTATSTSQIGCSHNSTKGTKPFVLLPRSYRPLSLKKKPFHHDYDNTTDGKASQSLSTILFRTAKQCRRC